MKIKNYVMGEWVEGNGEETPLYNAITGEQFATCSSEGLDYKAISEYAQNWWSGLETNFSGKRTHVKGSSPSFDQYKRQILPIICRNRSLLKLIPGLTLKEELGTYSPMLP
ncbi:MAG: hypothetical protein R2799_16190 [Crocinitomicaceae bacterium]